MSPSTPPDQRDRQDEYRRQHPAGTIAAVDPGVAPLQRAIIWGGIEDNNLDEADILRSPWLHLVTADLGTWDRDPEDLRRLRDIGPVEVWCDCRVDGGTHPQIAIDLAAEYKVGWVGQAETAAELEWAVGVNADGALVAPAGTERAQRIIGNPNSWTAKQQETANRMIEDGDLSVSGEQYAGPTAMRGYSAGGVDIASITLGVAMDGELYYPLADTIAELRQREDAAKFLNTILIWHGGGLRPEAWEAARSL